MFKSFKSSERWRENIAEGKCKCNSFLELLYRPTALDAALSLVLKALSDF